MKKLFFLSILLISGILKGYTQNLPPEVESGYSSFAGPTNFGASPVNMVTGAPVINIPIYTASSGNLSVPVSVSYSSNGMRASDVSSFTGLHWFLSAGGSVQQIVRGKNNMGQAEIQDSILDPGNYFLHYTCDGDYDGEPDLFSVNAPGLNVSFMLSEDGGFIKTIDSDIKIEYINPTYWYKGFLVTNGNGTQYYFERRKSSFSKTGTGLNVKYRYSFEWLLTKMINARKTDSILIDYYKSLSSDDTMTLCFGKYKYGTQNLTYDIIEDTVINNYSETVTDSILRFETMTSVKSISTKNEIVFFNYFLPPDYESPYDLYPLEDPVLYETAQKSLKILQDYFNRNERFLQSVEIRNTDSALLRSYNFKYFQNQYDRTFLSEISIKDSSGNEMPPYRFQYNDYENTGPVFSDLTDFWGFYNPGTTGSFIHKMFPENNPAGLINKVYYPAGAITNYYYEPNTYCFDNDTLSNWYNEKWKNTLSANGFFNSGEIDTLRGGGFRVKKTETLADGINHTKIFDYDLNGKSSGRLTAYPEHQIVYNYYDDETELSVSAQSSSHYGLEPGYILYEKITVYEDDKLNNPSGEDFGANGKTEYWFSIPEPEYFEWPDTVFSYKNAKVYNPVLPDTFPYDMVVYPSEISGIPLKTLVYDNQNNKLSEQSSNYLIGENDSLKRSGLRVVDGGNDLYYSSRYDLRQRSVKLLGTYSEAYATTGSGEFSEDSVLYDYSRNNTERKHPVSISTFNSKGDTILKKMYYVEDSIGDNGIYDFMARHNILSPPVADESFINNTQVSGKYTRYRFHITGSGDTLTLPDVSFLWEDGTYKAVLWFDSYNDRGQLTESHGIDGIHNCTLYGYPGGMPVASITDATYSEIDAALSQSDKATLADPSSDTELRNVLSALRNSLPNAYISSVTYKPLVGKTSETDANGNTVYYEYDGFGRLKSIFDRDSLLIKHYDYNLKHSYYPYDPVALDEWYLAPGNSSEDTLFNKLVEIKVEWDTLVLTEGDFVNVDFKMLYPVQNTLRLASHIPKENGEYAFTPEQHDSISAYASLLGKFIISCEETPTQADTSLYNVRIKEFPDWLTYPAPGQTVYRPYASSITITWEPVYYSGYDYYDIQFIPDNSGTPVTIASNVSKTLGEYVWTFDYSFLERSHGSMTGKIRISASANSTVFEDSGPVIITDTLPE